jgi:single-strand DNA-binding protein
MLKLQIIGNIGKDAEQKQVGDKTVINFSVCHTENWKDKDGNKCSKATWVECAQWTEKVGLLPYLTKGTMVYVEGVPEASAYQNKEGTAVGTIRLKVGAIQLLGGNKNESAPQAAAEVPTVQRQVPAVEDTSDLPF